MLSNLSSGTLQVDQEESIGVETFTDVLEPPDKCVSLPLRDENHEEPPPQVLQTHCVTSTEDEKVTLSMPGRRSCETHSARGLELRHSVPSSCIPVAVGGIP